MPKVLAVDRDGNLSYCNAKPENRGHGNCPHLFHARDGESDKSFIQRMSRQEEIAQSKNFEHCKRLYELERNKRFHFKLSEISAGDLFEGEIYNHMSACLRGKSIAIRKGSEIEDLFEGTDIWVDEARVDITINGSKFGAVKVPDVDDLKLKNVNVHFYIRTKNRSVDLPEPVVVCQFDADVAITKGNAESVAESLTPEEIMQICERILDVKYAYEDNLDA